MNSLSFTLDAFDPPRVVYVDVEPMSWIDLEYGMHLRMSLEKDAQSRGRHRWSVHEYDEGRGQDVLTRAVAMAYDWLKKPEAWENIQEKTPLPSTDFLEPLREAEVTARKALGYTHLIEGKTRPLAGSPYEFAVFTRSEPTADELRVLLKVNVCREDYRVSVI